MLERLPDELKITFYLQNIYVKLIIIRNGKDDRVEHSQLLQVVRGDVPQLYAGPVSDEMKATKHGAGVRLVIGSHLPAAITQAHLVILLCRCDEELLNYTMRRQL